MNGLKIKEKEGKQFADCVSGLFQQQFNTNKTHMLECVGVAFVVPFLRTEITASVKMSTQRVFRSSFCNWVMPRSPVSHWSAWGLWFSWGYNYKHGPKDLEKFLCQTDTKNYWKCV